MTEDELVARMHRALALHPAPPNLLYEELGPAGLMERLVTETVLYEEGPVRDWFLDFGRALIDNRHDGAR